MSFFSRLGVNLFASVEQRAAIRRLEKNIPEQSGDVRAFSDTQLYNGYRALAEKNKLLSALWEDVAWRHLEDAVESAQVFPEPLVLLANRQLQAGNFWDGRDNLARAISRQRAWVQHVKDDEEQPRLELCRSLVLAGSIELSQSVLWRTRRICFPEQELTTPANVMLYVIHV